MCKHSCPTYLASGDETVTPQKLARLILYHDRGLLEDEEGFYNAVFLSAMCGSCKAHCIYDDYDLRKHLERARGEAFKNGIIPEDIRKRVDAFREFGNPLGERNPVQTGSGESGYFVSCSALNDGKIVEAMDTIISASRDEVQKFGGDICCGGPLYYAGDLDGFARAAAKMKVEVENRGLRRLIVDCPNCMKMMTRTYPEFGIELHAEVLHSTEYLSGLLAEGKLRVRTVDAVATFHDPCILAFDLKISPLPRQVLERLGYQIREPAYSAEDTHCCGGVPGARIGDQRLTGKVNSMRLRELRETGAETYVSACPTCKKALSGLQLRDISELVAEHLVSG
jgi:Fe-S oxidoreductase